MTAAERATLAYIDSMIRQTESDVEHLRRVVASKRAATVDPAISHAERAYNAVGVTESNSALGDQLARLDDWKRVRADVDYLFAMREDWSPK